MDDEWLLSIYSMDGQLDILSLLIDKLDYFETFIIVGNWAMSVSCLEFRYMRMKINIQTKSNDRWVIPWDLWHFSGIGLGLSLDELENKKKVQDSFQKFV
jgi:hypothetical protein